MLRRRDLKTEEQPHSPPPVAQPAQPVPMREMVVTPAAGERAVDGNGNGNGASGVHAWQPLRQGASQEPHSPAPAPEGSNGHGTMASDESLIGSADFFQGTYRSERGVRVQGRVEGTIESKGRIHIEERAQVNADLAAQDITVAGRFNGKVECRRRFEITPTGVVTGEINTDLLAVQEGGYFDGKLKMKERSGAGRLAQGLVRAQGSDSAPEEENAPAQV